MEEKKIDLVNCLPEVNQEQEMKLNEADASKVAKEATNDKDGKELLLLLVSALNKVWDLSRLKDARVDLNILPPPSPTPSDFPTTEPRRDSTTSSSQQGDASSGPGKPKHATEPQIPEAPVLTSPGVHIRFFRDGWEENLLGGRQTFQKYVDTASKKLNPSLEKVLESVRSKTILPQWKGGAHLRGGGGFQISISMFLGQWYNGTRTSSQAPPSLPIQQVEQKKPGQTAASASASPLVDLHSLIEDWKNVAIGPTVKIRDGIKRKDNILFETVSLQLGEAVPEAISQALGIPENARTIAPTQITEENLRNLFKISGDFALFADERGKRGNPIQKPWEKNLQPDKTYWVVASNTAVQDFQESGSGERKKFLEGLKRTGVDINERKARIDAILRLASLQSAPAPKPEPSPSTPAPELEPLIAENPAPEQSAIPVTPPESPMTKEPLTPPPPEQSYSRVCGECNTPLSAGEACGQCIVVKSFVPLFPEQSGGDRSYSVQVGPYLYRLGPQGIENSKIGIGSPVQHKVDSSGTTSRTFKEIRDWSAMYKPDATGRTRSFAKAMLTFLTTESNAEEALSHLDEDEN